MDIVTLGAALSGAKKYTDDVVHGIAGGITYKGEVNYYSNLPFNPTLGDAYTVKYSGTTGSNPDGTEYVWAENGGVAQWIDFSKDAYTKAETDALLNNKQNVLTVGTNLDDEPIEDSTNPITSGGVYNTVGNLDAALDSLIMSLEPKTITANGTYNPADDGVDGYSEVTVNVANSYSQSDNGKVVSNQQLVSQTAYPTTVTENDTYDTTNYNSITVNVSGGGGSSNGVTIEGLTELGEMFSNNDDITSVIIGSDIETIGDNAFNDCNSLISVTISSSVTSIGDSAFFYCDCLETVTFETNSSLRSIGVSAFSNCTSLTSITIPNGVTSIAEHCFDYCQALTSVTIPNSVTSIGDGAFADCNELTSITIPNSVTSIGDNVFDACGNLETLTFEPTSPPVLDGDLRINTDCIIRIPRGTLTAYTSAENYPDPSEYIYEEY